MFDEKFLNTAAKPLDRLAGEKGLVYKVGMDRVGEHVAGTDTEGALASLRHLAENNAEIGNGVLEQCE